MLFRSLKGNVRLSGCTVSVPVEAEGCHFSHRALALGGGGGIRAQGSGHFGAL